uniref:Intracellular calcium channel modulator CCP-Ts n=1 Tax=Tityus serrulatus TaxID=6887 RepID=CLCPP_TITSE|nr:RecName: Full=Intracellular calcium channel modulator CCP-Ts; AltName: Full=CaTx; AltName: Full=Calcium channel toxin Ts32; AltName: Full=Cell penetrating peptides-Ts; Short=CPP; Short=CPP-Ts; AltName: Full=Tityustoxin-32; Flags: Precursor [Tityus serrulatus]AYD60134.1 CPP [Tityus serrulatus]QPD99059.1 calcium channel toxin Ts32 [Tityus serrulatus]
MNPKLLIVIGLLLATGVCSFAKALDEESLRKECNHLNEPCDSDGDCCTSSEQCISTGSKYFCKGKQGP